MDMKDQHRSDHEDLSLSMSKMDRGGKRERTWSIPLCMDSNLLYYYSLSTYFMPCEGVFNELENCTDPDNELEKYSMINEGLRLV